MYKSRIYLWGFVGCLCLIITVIFNAYSDYSKASGGIKSVVFSSDNVQIAKSVEGKKFSGGAKIIGANNNWNLYLSEGKPLGGYSYEEYYSPIIAIYSGHINSMTVNNYYSGWHEIHTVDLAKLLNGFMEEMTFDEVYGHEMGDQSGKDVIKVYADARYEAEIKQTILMSIARTDKLKKSDFETLMPLINEMWEKMEKVYDMDSFLDDESGYILLTPEYSMSKTTTHKTNVSFDYSVGIHFYLNYQKEYEILAKNKAFMKHSCLRRLLYQGAYRSGRLHGANYLTNVVVLDEEIYKWTTGSAEDPGDDAIADTAVQNPSVQQSALPSATPSISPDAEAGNQQTETGSSNWNIITKDDK